MQNDSKDKPIMVKRTHYQATKGENSKCRFVWKYLKKLSLLLKFVSNFFRLASGLKYFAL